MAERVTRTERVTGEAPAVIVGAADWKRASVLGEKKAAAQSELKDEP